MYKEKEEERYTLERGKKMHIRKNMRNDIIKRKNERRKMYIRKRQRDVQKKEEERCTLERG